MAPERPLAGALAAAAAALAEGLGALAAEAGPALERIAAGCAGAIASGGKVLFAGNGGSAAQCQHLAAELVVRLAADRAAYAALALTTDSSVLTAAANDLDFAAVFARQVEALGRPGDALVVLSTSGRSPNVVRAAQAGRSRGLASYAFTGRAGGPLAEACDESIRVPFDDPARVQEAHLFLGHQLCGAIEARLEGSDWAPLRSAPA